LDFFAIREKEGANLEQIASPKSPAMAISQIYGKLLHDAFAVVSPLATGLFELHDTPANFPVRRRYDRIQCPCRLTSSSVENLRNAPDQGIIPFHQRNGFVVTHAASMSLTAFWAIVRNSIVDVFDITQTVSITALNVENSPFPPRGRPSKAVDT